ncbi:MAG: aldo/keto reductase, partial [Bacteroidota bacterium]
EAKKRNVGIIARVPLASGLLTGKFDTKSTFSSDDHRQFNRKGEAFDQGETFSGIDYNLGLEALKKLQAIFPEEFELVHIALKWILMFEEVSCVIPGVSKLSQLHSNLAALNIRDLSEQEMEAVEDVYNEMIRPSVHHRW